MTPSKIEQVVRNEATVISNFYKDLKGEELRPLFFAFDEEMKRTVVAIHDLSPDNKHDVMRQIGRGFKSRNIPVVAVMFVSEAWAKEMTLAEAWRSKGKPLPIPSQSPDRIEVVCISFRAANGNGSVARAKIVGDGTGRAPGKWDFTSVDKYRQGKDYMLSAFFEGYDGTRD